MGVRHEHDTIAITDLNAYERNIKAIRAAAGPSCGVIAVVKANAYGHGLVPCGNAALRAGASMLAVAFTQEGAQLRRAGVTAPILVMAQESPDRLPALIGHDLTASLTSAGMLDELERASRRIGQTARVHLKIDTGMGRIGVPAADAPALAALADRSPHIRIEGVFSHFSTAIGGRNPFSLMQIELFRETVDRIARAGIDPGIRHLCNSAGMLNYPEAAFDMVRPGIMTYGLEPFPGALDRFPLEPVLSLKSRISFLKEVPAGFRVSYGGTFVTSRPSVLATVPIGYSDGYDRTLSNQGRAVLNGVYVPIAGQICMDQTVFDVTDAGPVKVGDDITLIGREGTATVTAEEHARLGETISYEIVTGIAGRVCRVVIPAD